MILKTTADRIENTKGGSGGLMTATSEVQRIVEIAILTLDLKYTKELSSLRMDMAKIPGVVDEKIAACGAASARRRRWNFSTIFNTIMMLAAAGSAYAALMFR